MRTKRFAENFELLQTVTAKERKQNGLMGPKNEAAMEKYTDQLQYILRELKKIDIEQLKNFHAGNLRSKAETENLMNIYFSI